jgi:hypothetical protein
MPPGVRGVSWIGKTQWRSRSPSLFRLSSPGFSIWRFGYNGNQGEIAWFQRSGKTAVRRIDIA